MTCKTGRTCLFLILALAQFSLIAQVNRRYREHGDKMLASGNATAALKDYFSAMSYDSADAALRYSIAEAYRELNIYKKAAYYYGSVQEYDKRKLYQPALHHKAEMEKCLGNYDQSQKDHLRFLKKYKGDRQAYEYLHSLYETEQYHTIGILLKDSHDIVLSNNHPVNSTSSEFAAFFTSGKNMLYSTMRSDSLKGKLVLDSLDYYGRIWSAGRTDQWQAGSPVSGLGDGEKIHIVNPALSTDRNQLYYNECRGRICSIWKATLDSAMQADNFTELPAAVNIEGYTASQPFLARIDGLDYLFFSSDRPGGAGRLDIWYCIAYSNGLYGDAVNLAGLNSPGNDICPFYLEGEKALYFSSDWYTGLGGFDIFRATGKFPQLTAPENLGIPLNSSYNDLYFRQDGDEAVITSNRPGALTDKYENCCNDLFFFSYKAGEIEPEITMTNMERIEKLLPLRLYFDNDEPLPASQDTTTTVSYSATYIRYMARLPVFEKEYGRGWRGEESENASAEINLFFSREIKPGLEDLRKALELLNSELANGTSLELVIKGYASPLSKSDYNKRLTLRRITSVENEIRHFRQGLLGKYLESGALRITRQPFGEDKLSNSVSDDRNDRRNAVYSKNASFERRVEIIAIRKVE